MQFQDTPADPAEYLPPQKPVVSDIRLDAESIRAELLEVGTENFSLSDEQVETLQSLPDDELNDAIHAVVSDAFWEWYDITRNDAIRRLIAAHGMGES